MGDEVEVIRLEFAPNQKIQKRLWNGLIIYITQMACVYAEMVLKESIEKDGVPTIMEDVWENKADEDWQKENGLNVYGNWEEYNSAREKLGV